MAILNPLVVNHPVKDALWFNVQEFGARGDMSQDDSVAIQATIDALAVAMQGKPGMGTVFLPQTERGYAVSRPIFMDCPNMQMVGGGSGATLQTGGANTIVYVGLRRTKLLDESLFPDAFGKLDAKWVVDKNQKCGLRTGSSHVQFQSNGFQYGFLKSGRFDYWEDTTQFTLEFCIEFPHGIAPGLALFGMGDWQQANSWNLCTSGSTATDWAFFFKTSDSDINRAFIFSTAGFTGVLRIALQLNLDAGTCSVLVNDKSVVATYFNQAPPSQYTKQWGPGLKFKANDSVPFMINPNDTADFTLYGLRISNVIRYPDPGVGQTLSTHPTDAQRYFTGDDNTVCYLTLQDRMSQNVAVWQQGNVYTSGLRVFKSELGWNSTIALRNLNVVGSWSAGQAISLGNVFGCELERLTVRGMTPIGSFSQACTYPLFMDSCNLGGADCCFFGYWLIMTARNTVFKEAGRDVIRCVSCDASWETVFVSSPSTDTVFKFLSGGYGAQTKMSNVCIDFEGYTVDKAVVYAENCSYVPATTLTLTDFKMGTVGGKAACIMLRDCGVASDTFRKAWLVAENISTWGAYRAFVDTDGPLWAGVVNAYFLSADNLVSHTPKYGPKCNVTFTNDPRPAT